MSEKSREKKSAKSQKSAASGKEKSGQKKEKPGQDQPRDLAAQGKSIGESNADAKSEKQNATASGVKLVA